MFEVPALSGYAFILNHSELRLFLTLHNCPSIFPGMEWGICILKCLFNL